MTPAGEHLDRLAGFANELKLASLLPQIAACRQRLRDGDNLDVAVFGRFKSGKSSLLNHLAGRDVLPIGVVPLTAVITRLRHGPAERAEVRFLDGTVRAIALADIGRYVSEQQNPANAQRVAAVDLELPSLARFAPLRFVDTPGLGSAFLHNTATALDWLPNVGAAFIAVSADASLSERDLALLAALRRHTPKIFLVLTKADLLDPAQRTEVRAFVVGQLRRQVAEAPPVHFYSVRPTHTALAAQFEESVLLPLLRQRGDASAEIVRHKLDSLAAQVLDHARLALAAATQAESARAELRRQLEAERREFRLLREELRVLSHQWAARALDESLAALLPVQRALQTRADAGLRAQFSGWRGPLPALLVRWREWLQAFLAHELGEVSRTETAMFCAPLPRTRDHLLRTLRAFHDRLAAHVQAALGFTPARREIALVVRDPAAPPVDVAFAFDAAFGILATLLPLTLVRPLVCRSLLRKTRYEVEKNVSRLAVAWRDRIAAEIDALILQAEQHASDELTELERALTHSPSSAPRLREIIANLAPAGSVLPEPAAEAPPHLHPTTT
jgi:GTP-binding protein EngB required for normal cell division